MQLQCTSIIRPISGSSDDGMSESLDLKVGQLDECFQKPVARNSGKEFEQRATAENLSAHLRQAHAWAVSSFENKALSNADVFCTATCPSAP